MERAEGVGKGAGCQGSEAREPDGPTPLPPARKRQGKEEMGSQPKRKAMMWSRASLVDLGGPGYQTARQNAPERSWKVPKGRCCCPSSRHYQWQRQAQTYQYHYPQYYCGQGHVAQSCLVCFPPIDAKSRQAKVQYPHAFLTGQVAKHQGQAKQHQPKLKAAAASHGSGPGLPVLRFMSNTGAKM